MTGGVGLARVLARGLIAAVVLGALAGCGAGTEPAAEEESAELADLKETAKKANKLSNLQQSAYTRNTLFRFSSAEQDYRETLSLARELFPLDPAKASSLRLHLALNKSNLGQFESAEDLFRRSRPIVKEIGTASERAKADLFYAQHLMNLKLFDRAEPLAREVLADLDAMIADARSGMTLTQSMREPLVLRPDGSVLIDQARANLLNARDRVDAAVTSQQLYLDDVGRLRLQRVHTRYVIARAIKAQGKDADEVDGLITASEQDLAQVPQQYGRWLRAEIASLKAEQLAARGDREAALASLDDAVETLRRYEVNSRPEALLLFRKGEMQLEGGQGAEGQATFREALKIIKEDEQGLEVEQAESLIDQLLLDAQAGDPVAQAELFEVLQKVRTSATAQTVAQLSARLASGDTAQANAIRRVQNLERETNILAARFDRLEADPNADLHLRRVTEQKLTDTRAELEQARAELAEIAPNYDQLTGEVIPLSEAQAALADGEVVAAIQLGPEKGLVLVLSNVSFDVYEIVLSVERAEEEVRALREPIDGEYLLPFDLERAHVLYRNLFGPATARVSGAKHLVVIPSGPLTSLPFNTLLPEAFEGEIQIAGADTGEPYFDYSTVPFLGRKVAITTGVSISSFFLGRKTLPGSTAGKRFIGFGNFQRYGTDPQTIERITRARELAESCRESLVALGTINELAGTADEIRRIAEILNVPDADVVMGAEFTEARVKETPLGDYQVVHFAAHGLLAQSPECLPEPALVTSIDSANDSLLEASEIVDLNLNADLVVMSACDTSAGAGAASEALTGFRGVGGSYAAGGESLNGLARGFFYAGARNVVASYWSVDDIATQALMVAFYGAAAKPDVGIAEAMREAEEAQIAGGKYSHPFFWAPFATIGDGARALRLGGAATASASAARI